MYVGAVVLLVILFGILNEGFVPALNSLLVLWTPFSVVFLIAFLLLAVARRWGLTILWVGLLGIWVVMIYVGPTPWIGTPFLVWSVLSLPLYALGVIGAPSTHRAVRRASLTIALVWLAFVVGAFVIGGVPTAIEPPSSTPEWFFRNGIMVWGPVPVLIGIWELGRLWIATRPVNVAAAA
jgi:hypothetical protein